MKKAARVKPGVASHLDLLKAILENPDDDKARLVYADALQDDGDPRGEFIALSLAGGAAAAKQAKELLDKHRQKSWQNFGAKGARYTWTRGFISAVGADAEELANAGPLMFEVEPIQSISIYGGAGGHLDKILSFPVRIRGLSAGITPADAKAIAKHAHALARVETLELSGFGDGAASALAETSLPKLSTFSASLGGLSDKGFIALAKGPFLANVTRLYLNQHDLGAAAMTALGAAPWAKNLEDLALSENPLGDAGIAALAASPNLGKLKSLRCANNWRRADQPTLGAGAADALVAAATTTFENLQEIDLSWNIAGEPLARVQAAYGDRLRMRREEDRFD